jgi:hypothetical protein
MLLIVARSCDHKSNGSIDVMVLFIRGHEKGPIEPVCVARAGGLSLVTVNNGANVFRELLPMLF